MDIVNFNRLYIRFQLDLSKFMNSINYINVPLYLNVERIDVPVGILPPHSKYFVCLKYQILKDDKTIRKKTIGRCVSFCSFYLFCSTMIE